jgi:hypothetical protein
MSDFLTNLVGRSLGTLAVVKPRVPSIYEPYRRGSGILGVQQTSIATEASLGSAIEPAPGDDPSATSISHRNNNLALQADGSAEPARRSPPPRATIPVADAHSEDLAGKNVRGRREATAEPTRMPIPTATHSSTTLPPAPDLPVEARPDFTPTEGELRGTIEGVRSVADSPHARSIRPVYPPHLPNTTTTRGNLLEASPRTTGNSDQANPASPRTYVPPSAPSLVAQNASAIPSVIRPPLASRSAERSHPTSLPVSGPPQSSIQVSIGRVEVRAVFPEPAARPSPVPRSRPTVSLDEYLKQGSRGKR